MRDILKTNWSAIGSVHTKYGGLSKSKLSLEHLLALVEKLGADTISKLMMVLVAKCTCRAVFKSKSIGDDLPPPPLFFFLASCLLRSRNGVLVDCPTSYCGPSSKARLRVYS